MSKEWSDKNLNLIGRIKYLFNDTAGDSWTLLKFGIIFKFLLWHKKRHLLMSQIIRKNIRSESCLERPEKREKGVQGGCLTVSSIPAQ